MHPDPGVQVPLRWKLQLVLFPLFCFFLLSSAGEWLFREQGMGEQILHIFYRKYEQRQIAAQNMMNMNCQ